MELINSIFQVNYFEAVIINYLIAFVIILFVYNQKKEYKDWEIPNLIYTVIAVYLFYGLIPVINQLLIFLTALAVFFIMLGFLLNLLLFEVKIRIERFLNQDKQ